VDSKKRDKNVDCKNRGNSNLWVPRKSENLTCGFQGLGEIKHVDSKNRGNFNMWFPRTGKILTCGVLELGEF
jgi:hypothetical protein